MQVCKIRVRFVHMRKWQTRLRIEMHAVDKQPCGTTSLVPQDRRAAQRLAFSDHLEHEVAIILGLSDRVVLQLPVVVYDVAVDLDHMRAALRLALRSDAVLETHT